MICVIRRGGLSSGRKLKFKGILERNKQNRLLSKTLMRTYDLNEIERIRYNAVNLDMKVTASLKENDIFSSPFQVAEETFSNIHTVVSLGREEEFFERYRTAIAEPYRYVWIEQVVNCVFRLHTINLVLFV